VLFEIVSICAKLKRSRRRYSARLIETPVAAIGGWPVIVPAAP
jgi:hypothetical protein